MAVQGKRVEQWPEALRSVHHERQGEPLLLVEVNQVLVSVGTLLLEHSLVLLFVDNPLDLVWALVHRVLEQLLVVRFRECLLGLHHLLYVREVVRQVDRDQEELDVRDHSGLKHLAVFGSVHNALARLAAAAPESDDVQHAVEARVRSLELLIKRVGFVLLLELADEADEADVQEHHHQAVGFDHVRHRDRLVDAGRRPAASDDQEKVDVRKDEEDPVDGVHFDGLGGVDHEHQQHVDHEALDDPLDSVKVIDGALVLVLGLASDLLFQLEDFLLVFVHGVDHLQQAHQDENDPVQPLGRHPPVQGSVGRHVERVGSRVAAWIQVQPLVAVLEVVRVSQLPHEAEVVLAKDEERNEEDQQDTALSVDVLVGRVQHEEQHVPEILDVVDV